MLNSFLNRPQKGLEKGENKFSKAEIQAAVRNNFCFIHLQVPAVQKYREFNAKNDQNVPL
jgi:hypothetical protein